MPSKRSIRKAKAQASKAKAQAQAELAALKERIIRIRCSFPNDVCHHHRHRHPHSRSSTFNAANAAIRVDSIDEDVSNGSYCVLGGHPCRVTSQERMVGPRFGGKQWKIRGIGLLDNKIHTNHYMGCNGICCPIVPRVTTVTQNNAFNTGTSTDAGDDGDDTCCFVEWEDRSTYYDGDNDNSCLRPPDEAHVVIEMTIQTEATPQQLKTLLWTIPFSSSRPRNDNDSAMFGCNIDHYTSFYQFILKQREMHLEQYRDVYRFYHFIYITQQWKDDVPCLSLYEQDFTGVLKMIFSFLCGSCRRNSNNNVATTEETKPWEAYDGGVGQMDRHIDY